MQLQDSSDSMQPILSLGNRECKPTRKWQLAFARDEIESPAPADVDPRNSHVEQKFVVGAAIFFERIGQDGKTFKGLIAVDGHGDAAGRLGDADRPAGDRLQRGLHPNWHRRPRGEWAEDLAE